MRISDFTVVRAALLVPVAFAASIAQAAPPAVTASVCAPPVGPADVSAPAATVGSGTPESCTEAALEAALAGGGAVVFACGPLAVTIPITREKVVHLDTVIDGGGLVTLDGGNSTRILHVDSTYEVATPSLGLQNLTLSHGQSSGPDIQGGGGAVLRLGGSLNVVNVTFRDNQCPTIGQDVAGGAINSQGGGSTRIVGSTFVNNRCSNGGAIGNLGGDLALVNSSLTGNAATGLGGNPGLGGNGGAISIDGQGNAVTLCGDEVSSNSGNAFGGGLFRVSYLGTEPTVIDRSSFEGNTLPNEEPSMAGGLFLQGTALTMTDTTIAGNRARAAGGLYLGPLTTAQITSTTFASNTASASLGGGLFIDGGVAGTLRHATFARNRAVDPLAFGGAIAGGTPAVVLVGTVFAENEAGNPYNPITCTAMLGDGGGNLQFPVLRAGGGSDEPGSLCAVSAVLADAQLGPLQDNGGPTRTLLPAAGSPAANADAAGCPAADQRGTARAIPCTSGAVEIVRP